MRRLTNAEASHQLNQLPQVIAVITKKKNNGRNITATDRAIMVRFSGSLNQTQNRQFVMSLSQRHPSQFVIKRPSTIVTGVNSHETSGNLLAINSLHGDVKWRSHGFSHASSYYWVLGGRLYRPRPVLCIFFCCIFSEIKAYKYQQFARTFSIMSKWVYLVLTK